jgi:hypothetical protein
MAEGGLTMRRADILRLLRSRFGPEAPAAFEAPLNALDDVERLGQLLDVAAVCSTLDDFRHALGTRRTRRS